MYLILELLMNYNEILSYKTMILSNTRFHVIKIYVFFPFFGGRGVQSNWLLSGEVENHQRKLLTNYDIAKFTTKKVTEIPKNKIQFFPFLGGRGGLIKLTLLFKCVENPPRKLLTNFEMAKLKTLNVMGLETSSFWLTLRSLSSQLRKLQNFP